MMRRILLAGAAITCVAAPASAQLAVIDSANLARSIETARNTLESIRKAEQQIAEAQRLYESVNGVTDIQDVARILDNRTLRGALPEDAAGTAAYVSSDLRDLGQLSGNAERIYGASNFRSGIASVDRSLEVLGRRASADQALAEYGLQNADQRAEGLGVLEDRLATSMTQREIEEIGARGSIETAAAVNELVRLQAAEDLREAAERRSWIEADARRRAEAKRAAAEARRRLFGGGQ